MARINVEDDLGVWRPFIRLLKKLGGDEDRAIGMTVRFWRIAQKYWGDECALVPEEEFRLEDLEVLIEAGVAIRRPGGIYAKGSEDRFDWYLQKVRASKKGGAANRDRALGEAGKEPADIRARAGLEPAESPLAPVPVPALVPALVIKNKEKKGPLVISDPRVEACKRTWLETVGILGQPRKNGNLSPGEDRMIWTAIEINGAELVDLALYGARYEPAREGFNPRENVDIGRVLTKDRDGKERIQKFIGYGSGARAKAEERAIREADFQRQKEALSVSPFEDFVEHADPSRVRELAAQSLKGAS